MKSFNKIFLTFVVLNLTTAILYAQSEITNKELAHTIDSLYKADQACALLSL